MPLTHHILIYIHTLLPTHSHTSTYTFPYTFTHSCLTPSHTHTLTNSIPVTSTLHTHYTLTHIHYTLTLHTHADHTHVLHTLHTHATHTLTHTVKHTLTHTTPTAHANTRLYTVHTAHAHTRLTLTHTHCSVLLAAQRLVAPAAALHVLREAVRLPAPSLSPPFAVSPVSAAPSLFLLSGPAFMSLLAQTVSFKNSVRDTCTVLLNPGQCC